MHYIVVDFEWNQTISYNSIAFKKAENKLLFEIIQIGAVKLDENYNIIGYFNKYIKPFYFKRVHPRIQRITGINTQLLADKEGFVEVYNQFKEFCEENPKFITWGGDDISVYKQNLDCYGIEDESMEFFNLQSLFSDKQMFDDNLNTQKSGLKNAMLALNIEENENLPFHNAANDAHYTAKILQIIDKEHKIDNYRVYAKKLQHNAKVKHIKITHNVMSMTHGLNAKAVKEPLCPYCNAPLSFETQLIQQASNRYIALLKCPTHGRLYMQIRFLRLKNKNIGMALSTKIAGKEEKAYVKTKILEQKSIAGNGKKYKKIILDPQYDGNMPFEDEEWGNYANHDKNWWF